ncbi:MULTISPECIES: hypothetical protein [Gardnerella]|uniref:hypothetical protein n=1 Tax=Gardnerella TaxID=2701 RepID=UPI0007E30291|nr:hypothetical protein [Gardnerella sp. 26-12]PMC51136.1 hypothetical protein CJ211_03650 [Gardnerella vaginalis]PMC53804.1 hypothetical protein CJ210_02200 [Gardnerella vaginalis]
MMRKATKMLSVPIISISLVLCSAEVSSANTLTERGNFTYAAGSLSSTTTMTDADLDALIRAFESVPADLQYANPRTTSNYETRLNAALHGLTFKSLMRRNRVSIGHYAPMVNWVGCALAIASFVFQYGVPIAKALGWLKRAKQIYRTVSAIWKAFKRGELLAHLGSDGAKFLESILGIEPITRNCLS